VVGHGHKTGPEGAPDLAGVNRLVEVFGGSVKRFFRAQQRSSMTSPMFNLPGRLVLGSHCYYEHLPDLLGEVRRRASEEEIGRAMKHLCVRPNYVHLNSLALGFLVGREQARLTGRGREDDPDRLAAVMDFWARVSRRYRNDGLLLPDQAGFSAPVLPEGEVLGLNERLRDDLPGDLRRRTRRMLATLELYTFILHGEARVGVVHHGPYPLGDGDVLLVKELVGLREDFYPWADLENRPPCPNIAHVMRLRGVRSQIVLFGTLTTEPGDYANHIVAERTFVVDGGSYHPLAAGEVPVVAETAADAQLELYRRVIDWDDRYRIEYGADLYAYLLKAFGDLLGFGREFGQAIRGAFASSIDRHLEDLYSGAEQPVVLQHIATTVGPVFSPVPTGAELIP
jgi:hypothetical protein